MPDRAVCGNAANETDLAARFTGAVLLEIDEPTMLARLDAPAEITTSAGSGTPASSCAAGCPATRPAGGHSEPFPSTSGSLSTRWWMRYSPHRARPPEYSPLRCLCLTQRGTTQTGPGNSRDHARPAQRRPWLQAILYPLLFSVASRVLFQFIAISVTIDVAGEPSPSK